MVLAISMSTLISVGLLLMIYTSCIGVFLLLRGQRRHGELIEMLSEKLMDFEARIYPDQSGPFAEPLAEPAEEEWEEIHEEDLIPVPFENVRKLAAEYAGALLRRVGGHPSWLNFVAAADNKIMVNVNSTPPRVMESSYMGIPIVVTIDEPPVPLSETN